MSFALEAAKKSIVLLKNESELLPLKKRNQTVAIIGQLANDKNSPLGNWRSQVEYNSAVSVVEGMNKYKGNKTLPLDEFEKFKELGFEVLPQFIDEKDEDLSKTENIETKDLLFDFFLKVTIPSIFA